MPPMMFKQCVKRLCSASVILALGAWILMATTTVSAAVVGEVEFSRGVGMAYVEGHNPRTLGKGLPLNEGDHLMTSTGAIAIIKLQDGTRMTLRPNSELVIQQYRFTENAADNSMVLRLLEGGFRAITGQISKNAPDAAKVITQTSTISIRGTDFDARICAADCKAESARVPEKARLNMVQASAKLVNAQGDVKMFLRQEVSSVAGPVSARSSDLIINKREFETSFTVGDGQILAIGGLLNDDERRTIERIPLLSDIPLIGELFKSRSRTRSKTNLMVFIRPTVLRSRADGDRLTARRYDYVREMQRTRNPDIEPSIDELLRDYMGAVPPASPDVGPGDVVMGAVDQLERPATGGPLQPAEIPPSNVSSTDGDKQ